MNVQLKPVHFSLGLMDKQLGGGTLRFCFIYKKYNIYIIVSNKTFVGTEMEGFTGLHNGRMDGDVKAVGRDVKMGF